MRISVSNIQYGILQIILKSEYSGDPEKLPHPLNMRVALPALAVLAVVGRDATGCASISKWSANYISYDSYM